MSNPSRKIWNLLPITTLGVLLGAWLLSRGFNPLPKQAQSQMFSAVPIDHVSMSNANSSSVGLFDYDASGGANLRKESSSRDHSTTQAARSSLISLAQAHEAAIRKSSRHEAESAEFSKELTGAEYVSSPANGKREVGALERIAPDSKADPFTAPKSWARTPHDTIRAETSNRVDAQAQLDFNAPLTLNSPGVASRDHTSGNAAVTLLPSGKTLYSGGGNPGVSYFSTCDIYNPITELYTPAASMHFARMFQRTYVINTGQVLLFGGLGVSPEAFNDSVMAETELYDPVLDKWTQTNSFAGFRIYSDCQAELLYTGNVLLFGGTGEGPYGTAPTATCQLFDVITSAWRATGSLTQSRKGPSATVLSNGNVLCSGGTTTDGNWGFMPATLLEVYVPTSELWHTAVPPTANIGPLATLENQPVSGFLTGSSAEGTHLTFSANDGALGSVSVTDPATGAYTYTPNLYAYGTDTFTFTVFDEIQSSHATINVTITHVNQPPITTPLSVTTHFDTPLQITLSGSDPDNDPLTYTITNPAHGIITGTAPNLQYTPAMGYVGSDGFTFKANDGALDSNIATVSINVTDTVPVAFAQGLSLHTGTAKVVVLTATDADNDALTYAVVAQPANGTITGTPPNLTYTSNTGYAGPDSFSFKANDRIADSNIAVVTITITDQPPIVSLTATPTILIEGQSVAFNSGASDPDGDPMTFAWIFGDGGTSATNNPTHVYATAGIYTATVTVTDIAGEAVTQSITINVFHHFDRPIARFMSSDLNGYVGQPLGFDASFSTDPKNNIVSYSWDFGDGSPKGSGQLISRDYTATGTYTITLTVIDGEGLTDTTTITMVIMPANQVGLFNSNIKYSVSWNRSAANSDMLSLSATVNIGDTLVTAEMPLSLEIVGQTFSGSANKELVRSTTGKGRRGTPAVRWRIKPNTTKGAPKGTYELTVSIRHANLGQAFSLAGAVGTKSAMAKIPIRLGIGASSFESGITSQFRFANNGAKASGGGTGPK